MQIESKHVQTPWELSDGDTSIWGTSPLNARVRIADIRQHSPMNGIDNKATARLIVRAVNSHEKLLDLVKRINYAFYVDGTSKALMPIMAETKAIIAEAEGK